jgi:tetratricopeptide (TPR) repeat protein
MACTTAHSVETCLQIIASGVTLGRRGDQETAERAFAAALVMTHVPGPAGSPSGNLALRALALYNVSLLRLRQGRKEAQPLREQATAFLDGSGGQDPTPPESMSLFNELMAYVLFELGEYRRAIPYCEASIQFFVDTNDSVIVAESLARAGKCYARIGLRDHAAVPLRAAVKIFRTLAGDPRLPSVLLDLGNALRKGSPEEAERCYQEVAELHVSRTQLESATPAWVNLGVLCSEQGRHAEALAHYAKALRVREQSLGTPPERIGTLLNNMAGAHRRMGQFPEALDLADRAIRVLTPVGGHYLACAYGTRGMILRDAGRDEEAVEWFRKSAAEHQKQPSPNLETLSEELENEAAALERLGRADEAVTARQRLESVRAAMAEVKAGGVEGANLDVAPGEGAVLIELDCGGRTQAVQGSEVTTRLQQRLAEVLKDAGTGYYGGKVVIPEATTLMYYGADAEAVFDTVQPLLREEPWCGGAKVTVRQGSQHREVLLTGRVM